MSSTTSALTLSGSPDGFIATELEREREREGTLSSFEWPKPPDSTNGNMFSMKQKAEAVTEPTERKLSDVLYD